jgi:hypothetical protein
MLRITNGGTCYLKNCPSGRFSAQWKLKIPKTSTAYIDESIAVGVEMKITINNPRICRNNLLNINKPLLVPPIFFHIISMGSLAKFISNT